MRFDLVDLSLFRHVVEAGSITHGAERAHLALAAASTRIRHMEQGLGAALLTRSRQGVTPTQAGRTLLQHARTMLAQAERLREDLGAYAGGLAGQVRVLSNTNALTEFLPETLSAFLATHPHVSVDLEERLSDEIVGLIAEGVGDIGIVAGTVDAGRLRDLSVPQRPLRAGGRARSSARAPRARSASPKCWTTISSGSIARARCSASSPTRRRAPAARSGCASSCARSTACAGWSSAMSASASCRRRPRAAPRKTMAINGGAAHRPLGAARPVDLRARLQGAAALCAATGGSYAGGEKGDYVSARHSGARAKLASPESMTRAVLIGVRVMDPGLGPEPVIGPRSRGPVGAARDDGMDHRGISTQ